MAWDTGESGDEDDAACNPFCMNRCLRLRTHQTGRIHAANSCRALSSRHACSPKLNNASCKSA
eukprot:5687757-Pleurochrysis_carterae.AAC.2